MSDEKIISKESFLEIRGSFREQQKKVILCHGVFDLLHYGHIEHLKEAKEQGDILVVSVTASKYVNKGPGRPYFNDSQRMGFLASLEIVDYVVLSKAVTVHEIIQCIQPDVYVKGQEYAVAENDVTGNIGSEQEIVEKHGGRIYFTQGALYSSTKLLNNFFDALPDKVIQKSRELIKKYGTDVTTKVRNIIDDFANLKVLVIGDIIVDDYVFCKVQGVTSKDNVISTRYDFKDRYAGGSLAIARHLANFANDVTVLSMTGGEMDITKYINTVMSPVNCEIIEESHFITPVKVRFLKRHPQRQEYDKLFSMNKLLDYNQIRKIDYNTLYYKLEELVPKYDLVVVCDYGHGLLNERAIKIIEGKAKFLALNCQTNSSNYGLNIITKYHRADCFVVDERELRLAFGQESLELETLLAKLARHLNCRHSWVTVGADGALGLARGESAMVPAVTLHVKDTVGAGDAFYSLAALAAALDVPIDIATLLSNVAGAIKTGLVGNSRPIGKVDLLKFINTILNV